MKTRYKLIGILILAICLQGCNLFDSGNSSVEQAGLAEEGLVVNFEEFHDPHDGVDPQLMLALQGKKIFPCANYVIRHETTRSHSAVDVRLTGADNTGVCLTALGPASVRIPFSDMDERVSLTIRDGVLRDYYEVRLSREKVEINPVDVTFSETEYTRYYLKPENSFHLRCNTRQSMSHLCDEFHALLRSELNVDEFEFPGDGFNPYEVQNHQQNTFYFSANYTYPDAEEFIRAAELLEAFSHEHIAGTQGNLLSIYNWRNEVYRSWTFLDE